MTRPRGDTICIECDISARLADGQTPTDIAGRFDLPVYLIRAVGRHGPGPQGAAMTKR